MSFSSGSSHRPSHTRTLSLRGCSSKYSHRLCKEVAALITSGSTLSAPEKKMEKGTPSVLGPSHREEAHCKAGVSGCFLGMAGT